MAITISFRAAAPSAELAYHTRTGMVLTRPALIALGMGSDCVLPVEGISAADLAVELLEVDTHQDEIDDAAAGHPCPGDKDRRIAELTQALTALVAWANGAEQAIQSEWGGQSSSEINAAEELLARA